MKVLLTGGTGFLGSHVAEVLKNKGHEVRALVRATSKKDFLQNLGVEFVEASLETGRLDRAVEGVEAVVHCAGLVKARSNSEFEHVNVLGTQNLVDAVLAHAPGIKRFVKISSLAAHGPSEAGRVRPTNSEPRPVSNYGRSKLNAERVALKASDKIPVTVIRPPAIYGPRDTEVFAFFQAVSRRVLPLTGRGNTASMIYAPDCAEAIVLALEKEHPSGSVYFIEDGRPYTWEEMGSILEDVLGVRALRVHIPGPVFSAVALGTELYGKLRNQAVMLTRDKLNELRQPHWVCNAEELRRDLGWEPSVDFAQGAKITADWYRHHGWL